MKIKLLPFNEAVKNSKNCYKEHLTTTNYGCIGIPKSQWRDNAILEVSHKDNDGYFLGEDGYYYCECCCEVVKECSACGYEYLDLVECKNYCGNCGAIMDEVNE